MSSRSLRSKKTFPTSRSFREARSCKRLRLQLSSHCCLIRGKAPSIQRRKKKSSQGLAGLRRNLRGWMLRMYTLKVIDLMRVLGKMVRTKK